MRKFRYWRRNQGHTSSTCSEQELKTMREAAAKRGGKWDDYFDVEEVSTVPAKKAEAKAEASKESTKEKPASKERPSQRTKATGTRKQSS